MSVKSAKNGTLTVNDSTPDDITDITVETSNEEQVYASSSTGGNKSRVAGHDDASGSFTMKNEEHGFVEGTTYALVIKSDSGTTIWEGNALVSNISYAVPVEAGSLVESVITWGQVYAA